jgi:hypothetical protein
MEPLAQGTRVKIIGGKDNFQNVTGTIVGLVIDISPFAYIIKPDDETLDFITGFEEPYPYTHITALGDCLELI